MKRQQITTLLSVLAFSYVATICSAQVVAKAEVGNRIRKVEDGVDQFRDYLNRRGETAQSTASNAKAQGRQPRRTATEGQKANATVKKDDLENALDDLNRSTNRLRRKFDATDTWMETKVQVDQVLDDGRRINRALTRGNYGSEAARLWGVLRAAINDLARVYNLPPMGV